MVRHWLANNPEVKWTLIFDRPCDAFASEKVDRVILGPTTSHTPSIALWNERSVTRWLNKNKPDIYYSPDGFIPLRSSVRCVPVVHDLAPLIYPQYMRWRDYIYYRLFQVRMIRKAWFVSTVSNFSKNEIVNYCKIKPEKVFVGYNGLHSGFIDQPKASTSLDDLSIDKPHFLYYGSIHPRKNVFGVIKSFEKYREKGGQAMLVIAGRRAWKSNEVDELLNHSPVAEHMIWLPYLESSTLQMVLREALGLIYISHYEGFGLPVLEAMDSGVPVITSENSAMSEVGGDAVITCSPLDHAAIADMMKELESDPSLRTKLVERGKERAKQFSYLESSQQVLKLLKSKLNEA